MLTNGAKVRWLGIHRNAPSTSGSGFSDAVSMTYTGAIANRPSSVSTITRAHRNQAGSCMAGPPSPQRQVCQGHQQQEQQEQHGHG